MKHTQCTSRAEISPAIQMALSNWSRWSVHDVLSSDGQEPESRRKTLKLDSENKLRSDSLGWHNLTANDPSQVDGELRAIARGAPRTFCL